MLNESDRKLIDKLPPGVRARFVKLHVEHDGLAAATREHSMRRTELRESIRTEQDSLNKLLNTPSGVREDEAIVTIARESIARKQRELLELDAAIHDGAARRQSLHQMISRTLDFLRGLPAGMLPQPSNRPQASLRKGEALAAAVDRCRRRAAELNSELAQAELAPIPSSIAKENATRAIEQLAQSGRPNVAGMIDHGGPIEWPERVLRIVGEAPGYVDNNADTLAMMAYLFKDQLVTAVYREIDAAADDDAALSPEDRAAAVKKISAQIDENDRDEVAYVEQAERAGLNIEQRADVGIYALLDLSAELLPGPKPSQQPQMTGQPNRRHIEAPVHGDSLPRPARRGEVWQ